MEKINKENEKSINYSDLLKCNICNEEYDTDDKKPLILNCGHSFCKECIINIITQKTYSNLKCPLDEKQLHSNDISSYKINYSLLSIIIQYFSFMNIKNRKKIETNEGLYYGEYKIELSNYIKDGFGEMKYKDGSYYKGEFKNNKKEGKGFLKYKNGEEYDGEFKNDLPNGKGIFTFKSGEIISYEGSWRNGEYFGFGKIKYRNGIEIETIFLEDNQFIDIMKIKNKDGNIFYGHINQNDKSIIGKGYEIKDGNIYIGNFIYDKESSSYIKNGNDFIIYYKNGNIYFGEINMNEITGKGKIIYNNGNKYKGDFLKEKKHGKGIMVYNNGYEYNGEFKFDKKDGNGILKKEKYYYDGSWSNDIKNGSGIECYDNGETYCGDFKNGKKEGNGVYVFNNNNTYKGEWKNDQMNGKGIIYNSKGEFEGEFKNGMLVKCLKNNCNIF